jgi:hypothetical protein
MKRYLPTFVAAFLVLGHPAVAADNDPIRIGVLNDSSGLYADERRRIRSCCADGSR